MIIDQLPALQTAGDNDEIVIEVGTTTYKIKKADFLKEFMPKSGGTFSGNVTMDGNLNIGKINNFLSVGQIGVSSGQSVDINIPNSSAIYMLMSGLSIAIHGICIARANASGSIVVSSFSCDGGTLAVTFTTSQNTLTVNNGGIVYMYGLIFRT